MKTSKVIITNRKTNQKQTLTPEQAQKIRDGKFADRFDFKDVAEPEEVKAAREESKATATASGEPVFQAGSKTKADKK